MLNLLNSRVTNPESRTADTTSPTIKRINALLENYPLSTLLPYETFDKETGLYFNKASTGFVLGAEPLTGANEETIRILSSIITESLPEHATLQFLLFASPEIEDQLLSWKNQRNQSVPLYKILAGKRVEYLNFGKYSSLAQSSAFLVRNFKVVTGDLKLS